MIPHLRGKQADFRMVGNDEFSPTDKGQRRNPGGASISLSVDDCRAFMAHKRSAKGILHDEALDAKFVDYAETVMVPAAA